MIALKLLRPVSPMLLAAILAATLSLAGCNFGTASGSTGSQRQTGSSSTFRDIVSKSLDPSATSMSATHTVDFAALPQPSPVTVLTYHNDLGRTGLNPNEAILSAGNVNSTAFGKIGTIPVNGLVDAEPLYVGGLTINGAKHNVLFVATEGDVVYAFDADTFAQLWSASMVSAFPGEAPSDHRNCGQIEPGIGITSTPVIDLSAGPNGTIFVVAMSKDSSGNYHQRLHALDLTTGNDRITAQAVQASAAGTGTGSSGGTQTFAPGAYEERAALLLLNGMIYTTWTSHCDASNYTSWVLAFNESNLQLAKTLNLTANGTTQGGQEGGIWMAGSGPAADASGNIYFIIGNGTFDTTLTNGFPSKGDYGNSFMKVSTAGSALAVSDYFTMFNACCGSNSESTEDVDFGSGGAMVLPDLMDSQSNVQHLAVGAGKDSNMYIVDRDNMGKFNPSNDNAIYQEMDGALSGGIWSAPAYFNGTIYYGPMGGRLLAFPVSNAVVGSASSQTATAFNYPGATPSISSNGSSNGIVWAIDIGNIGVLHAYDSTNLATELYNSNQAGTRDQFHTNTNDKFVTPLIANGKVYVGTPGAVVVFGLNP